jgi:hypothetical protein
MFSPGAATILKVLTCFLRSCKGHAGLFPWPISSAVFRFLCAGKSAVAFVLHLTDNLTDW